MPISRRCAGNRPALSVRALLFFRCNILLFNVRLGRVLTTPSDNKPTTTSSSSSQIRGNVVSAKQREASSTAFAVA